MTPSDTRLPATTSPAAGRFRRRADVGILLVPGFALLPYASAVEPLRAANRLADRQLYGWRHVSIDG